MTSSVNYIHDVHSKASAYQTTCMKC